MTTFSTLVLLPGHRRCKAAKDVTLKKSTIRYKHRHKHTCSRPLPRDGEVEDGGKRCFERGGGGKGRVNRVHACESDGWVGDPHITIAACGSASRGLKYAAFFSLLVHGIR